MAQSTLAMSRKEFCQQFGVGNTLFYKMQKAGEGPKLMRVGHRILIAHDTALAWMRSREQAERPAKPARTKTARPIPPVDGGIADTAGSRASPVVAAPRRAAWNGRDAAGGMPRRRPF